MIPPDGDPRTPPLLIPFLLLGVSVLFSLLWQIVSLQAQRSTFQTTKAQLAAAIQKREPQVAQAVEIKARFEALANDLLALARTDPNAAAIVKKYEIRRDPGAAAH